MNAEQIKPGYKRTEVGVIPEDWAVVTLGDAVDFLDGRRKPVKDSDRARMRGDIPYYGASGVVDYVNDYLFDEPLILLGEDGENILSRNCRLAFKISGKSWINNHAHVLRPKSGFDLDFLTEYLESLDYSIYNTGTAQPKLNKQVCSGIPVAAPPLLEQKRIAAALQDIDTQLAQLDQLIAKKRDLKQAAMQQLLTGQTRLPGFSGEWEVKRLGDFSRFLRNGTFSRAELEEQGGTHYLHYGDIHTSSSARLDAIAASTPYLSESKARTLDRLECGDLVFADASEDYNGVGKSVEISNIGSGLVSGLHTIPIRFQKSILADGFKAHLQFIPSFRNHLLRLASGTKVYATQRSHIASAELKLPPVEEQTAIATVLSDMDAELAALEARRDKTRALKQGMMQELLTGRIRLV